MRIAVFVPTRLPVWLSALNAVLPEAGIFGWTPGEETPEADYVVVRAPPAGALARLSGLKAILLLSAGADTILSDPDRPANTPLFRLLDGGMMQQMIEYGVYGVLHFHRNFDLYRANQAARRWQPVAPRPARDTRVGILGLGVMGKRVAEALQALGFTVAGWSRSQKSLSGIAAYSGRDGLLAMAGRSNILINLLPLTPDTAGILGTRLFEAMPAGAAIISLGRGEHLDEAALVAALESGRLRGAMLDVFRDEPLTWSNPLWSRLDIVITPHVAAWTQVDQAAGEIAGKIRALEAGIEPPGRINESHGY